MKRVKKKVYRMVSIVMLVVMLCGNAAFAEEEAAKNTAANATGITLASPSAILMEASTGQIICEQEADVRRSPASITKIMTLLLIFDHLDTGRIKLEDEIITSAYAKSMGGSQVFLEGTVIIGLNQKTFCFKGLTD